MSSGLRSTNALWGRWLAAGLLGGSTVVGATTALLGALDRATVQFLPVEGLGDLFWITVFGATYGGVGGLLAGVLCATVTTLAERQHVPAGEPMYVGVGAACSGLGALAFCGFVAVATSSLGDLLLWVVAPVAISTGAGAVVGRWVWRHTRATPLSPLGPPSRA